jgi:hypothetical protein
LTSLGIPSDGVAVDSSGGVAAGCNALNVQKSASQAIAVSNTHAPRSGVSFTNFLTSSRILEKAEQKPIGLVLVIIA